MISSIHKSSINSQLIGLNSIRDNSMRDQCAVVNSPVLPSFNRGDLVPEILGNWVIQTGVIRTMTWDGEGSVSVLGLWGGGDLIRSTSRNIEPYQSECLTPVVLSRLNVPQLLPELLLKQCMKMEELLALSHCRNVGDRLLRMLYWLVRHFGVPHCDRMIPGRLIDMKMTHQHLADLTGTTRVTVTRCLGNFERDGQIVRLRRGRIFIQS
jgi:CRP-like cAMP-binding protein